MGYEVDGSGYFVIEADQIEPAYQTLCALNERDDWKNGGTWKGGERIVSNFSWMDSNYPETCRDLWQILEELGFSMTGQQGCTERPPQLEAKSFEVVVKYSNKTGQEQLFLAALAPHIRIGVIEWTGEDGFRYKNVFKRGVMDFWEIEAHWKLAIENVLPETVGK